jgi:F-type H+-transporting ATPase subunit b|tara:strand:+ start:809 stop:1306 length:498 start_codon:yes stop_codon:yes gene_type:complete
MIIDASFWVAISFLIFIGLIFYFKIPQKIKISLDSSINEIKNQISDAEKLKEEAKDILNKEEERIGNSKSEIKSMINKANEEAEKNIIKTNANFHAMIENKKKNAEQRIGQMKDQAFKDIKNASVETAIESVERLLKNSLDKSKLDRLFSSSVEETKLALKKKSS